MRYFFGWVICLVFTSTVNAQFLGNAEQNPASLRWYQLRSDHFRLIYPQGADSVARRTLSRLEQVYEPVSRGLGRRPRLLPVLLQNQTTISNGFVTLLPRRSEFFTSPTQDPFLSGTLNWLDLLAIHEYRHVVQYEKALTGFSGLVYRVFGYGPLSGLTLGVPNWFWEGDAVGAETVLSQGGRGRIPEFDLGFRANLLAGRRYSYPKAVGGSFRDNVPDHYVLGYFLTTRLKRQAGPEVWGEVLNRYYRFPLYPFSFSHALRKTTGLRVEQLYRQTLDELTEKWQQEQRELAITAASPLATSRNRSFTNYRYPQFVDAQTVLALKSGLGDITQWVLLSGGKERRVHQLGLFNNPELVTAAAGKVVWTEFTPDPRWGQRVYSDIKVLDLATGKVIRLTYRKRYALASISPDGSRLIAVRNDEDGRTRLVVLQASDGRELRTLPGEAGEFFQHPRWMADNRQFAVVRLNAAGKALLRIDSETGERQTLLAPSNENISHPQPWQEWVFYNSARSGIDNVYAVHTETGERFQVTSRPLGAYHAAVSPEGTQLAFHDFTADGHRIVTAPLDRSRWTPIERVRADETRYFGPLLKREPGIRLDTLGPLSRLETQPYNRLTNSLNIYSWGPLLNSNGQQLQVGLESQDLLGTTLLSGGYTFDANERTSGYFANLSLRAWYPIIDFTVSGGQRRSSVYIDRATPLDSLRSDNWMANRVTAGVRLPLRLTRSRFQQNMSLGAFVGYTTVAGYDLPRASFGEITNGSLGFMNYSASYSLLLRQARRDVAPRWGLALSGSFRNTPFNGRFRGELAAVNAGVFVPGIGKHHTIRFRGAYQQQLGLSARAQLYRFAPAVLYPRGAPYIAFDKLWIGGAEYHLPLLNPHWTLGRWLYIQRVKSMVFTDLARGESRVPQRNNTLRTVTGQEHTVGADLTFVFNPLRLGQSLEVGVRSTYNVRTGQFDFQPLVIDIGF